MGRNLSSLYHSTTHTVLGSWILLLRDVLRGEFYPVIAVAIEWDVSKIWTHKLCGKTDEQAVASTVYCNTSFHILNVCICYILCWRLVKVDSATKSLPKISWTSWCRPLVTVHCGALRMKDCNCFLGKYEKLQVACSGQLQLCFLLKFWWWYTHTHTLVPSFLQWVFCIFAKGHKLFRLIKYRN